MVRSDRRPARQHRKHGLAAAHPTRLLFASHRIRTQAWAYYGMSREAFHFASDLHVPVNGSVGFLPVLSTVPSSASRGAWGVGTGDGQEQLSTSASTLPLPFALSIVNAVELQLNAWPIFVGLAASLALLAVLAYLVRPSKSYERVNLIIPGTR